MVANRDFYLYASDEAGNEIDAGIGSLDLEWGFKWEKLPSGLYQVTLPVVFDLTVS